MRKFGLACLLAVVVAAPALSAGPNTERKGSVVIWPHVQISWDPATNNVWTDTIITLVNDSLNESVRVKFYMFQGDCQVPDFGQSVPVGALTRGCNTRDCQFTLTGHEPLYWSAFTGTKRFPLNAGVQHTAVGNCTFRSLDTTGRLDPEAGGAIRRIRGFLVAIAVVNSGVGVGNPTCFDNLSGTATVINYARTSAFQYKAYTYTCIAPPAPVGTNALQVIRFDNAQYSANWEQLIARFFAWNAPVAPANAAYGPQSPLPGAPRNSELNGRLTLLPVKIDGTAVASSNSQFRTELLLDVFNENESGLTGNQKCICCWDSALFDNYALGALNGAASVDDYFRASLLGTDHGYAIIDAPGPDILGFDNCRRLPSGPNAIPFQDLGSNPSQAAPLIGVTATLARWGTESFTEDGSELTGVGADDTTGLMTYRVSSLTGHDEDAGDVATTSATKPGKASKKN